MTLVLDDNRIEGLSVFVYRNLHLRCYSIRGNKRGIVFAHLNDGFSVNNAVFKVSSSGRDRVLREKRKNVHAGIRGNFQRSSIPESDNLIKVSYNPYLCDSFYVVGSPDKKVFSAKSVFFLADGIYAEDVVYM
jgi:hypothetical protein